MIFLRWWQQEFNIPPWIDVISRCPSGCMEYPNCPHSFSFTPKDRQPLLTGSDSTYALRTFPSAHLLCSFLDSVPFSLPYINWSSYFIQGSFRPLCIRCSYHTDQLRSGQTNSSIILPSLESFTTSCLVILLLVFPVSLERLWEQDHWKQTSESYFQSLLLFWKSFLSSV